MAFHRSNLKILLLLSTAVDGAVLMQGRMDWMVRSLCSYKQIDGSLKYGFLEKWVWVKKKEGARELALTNHKDDGFCVVYCSTKWRKDRVFKDDICGG